MYRRRYLWWPITLGVVMIVLLVALIVGWVLMPFIARQSNPGLYWAVLALGTTFLALALVGVVLYLLLSIKEIRLNHRQSNFIDSVTHELKSPIASLKLCLQTLNRRNMGEEQQAYFLGFMLKDLDRLDTLINHLLDAARLDNQPAPSEICEVELSSMLRTCAETACLRYRLPLDTIQLNLQPAVVRGRPADLEMIFRNLVDNAIKYAGTPPEVRIECQPAGDRDVVTLVIDNGPGIPPKLRRKIFRRFFRLGSELERSQAGTGLGLYIVGTLIRRLRGKIDVRSPEDGLGTIFEVHLPGRPADRLAAEREPASAVAAVKN
jgi:signal transduction histidine kinase